MDLAVRLQARDAVERARPELVARVLGGEADLTARPLTGPAPRRSIPAIGRWPITRLAVALLALALLATPLAARAQPAAGVHRICH